MRTFYVRASVCLLAGSVGVQPAWSALGDIVSHQKISDTVGGFTAPFDDDFEFGGAVANLGDLDGGGPSTMAVAVGAIGNADGGENRGAVYILFLNPAGSVLSHTKLSSTAGVSGLGDLDEFGGAIANLGDLDGGGPSVLALAVGATGDDDGGTDRGAVYILFLNSAGGILSQAKISDTAGSFTAPLANVDEFGGTISSLGDLDGGGPAALAIAVGAIGDNGGGANRGAAYVLFLNSAGSTLSWVKIGSGSGGFTETLIDGDEFGSSVCGIGDLDGGGPSAGALVVGAIGEDDGGTNAGCIYVLFLSSTGTVLSYQKTSDNTVVGFTEDLASLDEFGGSLANLGSIGCSAPSIFALAVGAAGEDDGGSSRGSFYILYMDQTGNCNSYRKVSDTAGNFTATLDNGDEFGCSIAALGTGTSSTTLVVGASFDDDGGTAGSLSERGAVYVIFLEGCPTDVSTPPGAPRNVLGQAWPNPFNPRTTVPFSVVEAGRIEIDIWDASGRRVRKLVQADFEPGDHTATWNGLDDAGRSLASGAYFFRMSVNGRAVEGREKAVLLK